MYILNAASTIKKMSVIEIKYFIFENCYKRIEFCKEYSYYYNTISLSRHEQVCLMRLRFERYFSHHRAM